MSLKRELQNFIREHGNVSLDQVHQFATERGHKQSYAERQLRSAYDELNPVYPIKNERGYIVGYKWQGTSEARNEPERGFYEQYASLYQETAERRNQNKLEPTLL